MKTKDLYAVYMEVGENAGRSAGLCGRTIIEVFLSKDDAEPILTEIREMVMVNWGLNEVMSDYYREMLNKSVEIITLDKAIEKIKEEYFDERQ